jgi:hypothetical protein
MVMAAGIYNELYDILNMNGGSINGNTAYGSGVGSSNILAAPWVS